MKKLLIFVSLLTSIFAMAAPGNRARIDFRNLSKGGKIQIIDKAAAFRADRPKWMHGGARFEFSAKSNKWETVTFKVKVIKDGYIRVNLLAPSVRSKTDPKKLKKLEIEYSFLKINKKVFLNSEKSGKSVIAWHNDSERFNYLAKDGDILTVSIKYRPAMDEKKIEQKSKATWIWYPENAKYAKLQNRYFRKKFKLNSDIKSAELFITADDTYKVYINGQFSKPAEKSVGGWKVVKSHNIKPLLKKGGNVIAIQVKNISSAAGVILKLEVTLCNGRKMNVYSSNTWLCARAKSPQWTEVNFDDRAWKAVKVIGGVLSLPWSNYMFKFSNLLAADEKFLWADYELKRNKLINIDIAGLKKEKAPHVKVIYDKGRAFIDVNGKKIAPFAYISHRLVFQKFWSRQISNFSKAGTPVLIINLPSFLKLSKNSNDKIYKKLDQEIRRHLVLNPKAYLIAGFCLTPPVWWLKANPDEWVGFATGKVDPKNKNVNRGRGRIASMASRKWREYSKKEMAKIIRYIEKQPWSKRVIGYRMNYGINGEFHYYGMRREMPDTGVAMTRRFRKWLRHKYNSVEALRKAWNDNNVDFSNATVPGAKERQISAHLLLRSPATERKVLDYYKCFQGNLTELIIEFARFIKKETDNKLLVGVYYGYLFGMPYPPEGFHLELQKILSSPYLDFLAAPYAYDRRARDIGGNGISRTIPALFRIYKKLHLLEDDTFTHLAKFNKGHSWLKTEKESVAVLKRQLCGAICNGYGIQYIDFPDSKSKYGWFESPALMNTIKEGIKLYKDAPASSSRSGNQVCVVASPENIMYLSHTKYPATLGYNLISGVVFELSRTGAPFDIITPEEIKEKSLPDYKLYIFLNCFYLSAKARKDISETVKRGGKTAIWLYAAGAVTEQGVSDKAIAELTGFSVKRIDKKARQVVEITRNSHPLTHGLHDKELVFPLETREIKINVNGPVFEITDDKAVSLGVHQASRKPALAVKKFAGWTSIYCAVPFISRAMLNNCLKQAGVHRYLTTEDTIYANAPFLMVHTKSGGKLVIALPRTAKSVKTMFGGKVVGKNISSIKYNFTPNSTTLFCVEY